MSGSMASFSIRVPACFGQDYDRCAVMGGQGSAKREVSRAQKITEDFIASLRTAVKVVHRFDPGEGGPRAGSEEVLVV